MRVKSFMSLKVRSILGFPKKNSKSQYVGRISDFYVKNYRFQVVIWSQMLSFLTLIWLDF